MDPEIEAMAAVAAALEKLDADAAQRVIRWANQRWSTGLRPGVVDSGMTDVTATGREGPVSAGEFADFHEFFDAAGPATGLGRILATAYWFQVVGNQDDFESFQINKELKNLGHPSGNITRDLSSLMNRSPRLVMQTRKEGKTKQARKKYRLTREGIRAVEQMLGGQGEY